MFMVMIDKDGYSKEGYDVRGYNYNMVATLTTIIKKAVNITRLFLSAKIIEVIISLFF
jgi:hypothetical protein